MGTHAERWKCRQSREMEIPRDDQETLDARGEPIKQEEAER